MAQLKTVAALKALFETGDIPSQLDFADLIEKASTFGGDAIFTTKGRYFDLTGLNEEGKGSQLLAAVDGVTVDEWIFLPPGEYHLLSPIHWKQRDAGIIGMGGSSKACWIRAQYSHAFILDCSYTLYNSVHKNFAVETFSIGQPYDAIHIAGIDGPGISTSNIEMDVHISDSDRYGLYMDAPVNSGRFILKTTGQGVSTSVDEYMLYVVNGRGVNYVIDNNQKSKFYFGPGTSENAVLLRTTIGGPNGDNATWENEGAASNTFFCPSDVDAFIRQSVLPGARIVSPTLNVPKSKIACFYSFDQLAGGKFLDHSEHQADASAVGGVTITDSVFGRGATFNGTDGYAVLPDNGNRTSITQKVAMGILFSINEMIQSRILYGTNVELEYEQSTNRFKFGLTLNGVHYSQSFNNVVQDQLYLLTYYYDGSNYHTRRNGIANGSSTDLIGATVNVAGNIDVARISTNYLGCSVYSFMMLNDGSIELVKAMENAMMKNINALGVLSNRGNDTKRYGDISFEDDAKGVVLTDRTTSTQYRLFMNNGTLSTEAI